MKCYYHEERDAVATCKNCGKALCKECASKNNPCMCSECIEKEKNQKIRDKEIKRQQALIDTKAEYITAIIKGILSVIIMRILFQILGIDIYNWYETLMLFFLPFGWAILTYLEQFLPPLFLNGLFYLVYIILKFAFSLIIGIFAFAFQTIKFIIKIIYHKRSEV